MRKPLVELMNQSLFCTPLVFLNKWSKIIFLSVVGATTSVPKHLKDLENELLITNEGIRMLDIKF